MNCETEEKKEAAPPICRLCRQPMPGPGEGMDEAVDDLCPFCRQEEESCGCSDEEQ